MNPTQRTQRRKDQHLLSQMVGPHPPEVERPDSCFDVMHHKHVVESRGVHFPRVFHHQNHHRIIK